MHSRRRFPASLLAALCAAALFAPRAADAVNLATDNSGEVLLFPYYTTRNGFATSLSVVNTNTFHTKAVKVRMREGRNGASVFDVNVWLPPRDVWTASIVDNGTGAAIFSTDRSCTYPPMPASALSALAFSDAVYAGQAPGSIADNAGTGLDRTREGFIEIIEMGVAANGMDAASSPSTQAGIALAAAVKLINFNEPAGCNQVRAAGIAVNGIDLREPVGGLAGSYILIQAATGAEFAGTPVALQNFYNPSASNALYTDPGSALPNLTSVTPARSVVIGPSGTAGPEDMHVVPDWVAIGGMPIDAVSAVLMRDLASAEFDVSEGIRTDVIVTMPTKQFYVNEAAPPAGPFANAFTGAGQDARACDTVFDASANREAAPYAVVTGVQFLEPTHPANGPRQLCWSATVISVGQAVAASDPPLAEVSVFGSANPLIVGRRAGGPFEPGPLTLPMSALPDYDFSRGWISLIPSDERPGAANGPGQTASQGSGIVSGWPRSIVTDRQSGGLRNFAAAGRRYRGLPMLGFSAIRARVGGQGYGGIFNLKYPAVVR